eukprot:TRINITY_DN7354_c0_g1_i1.p1 TRINITY_DN7354_c0_g1~~TRINITY_DN7354_c0_g1_i1.p1  ORF type:complete len:519 (-),score=55.51 TRINITY_DN7354_c0_g1_i1:22-1578(-)
MRRPMCPIALSMVLLMSLFSSGVRGSLTGRYYSLSPLPGSLSDCILWSSGLDSGLRSLPFGFKYLGGAAKETPGFVGDWRYGDGRANLFGVRWSGLLRANSSGHYSLSVSTDDGMRIWVDGALVFDQWRLHPLDLSSPQQSSSFYLDSLSVHTIEIDYFQYFGYSYVAVSSNSSGCCYFPSGLNYSWYHFDAFSEANLVLSKVDVMDFSELIPAITECMSWSGYLLPPSSYLNKTVCFSSLCYIEIKLDQTTIIDTVHLQGNSWGCIYLDKYLYEITILIICNVIDPNSYLRWSNGGNLEQIPLDATSPYLPVYTVNTNLVLSSNLTVQLLIINNSTIVHGDVGFSKLELMSGFLEVDGNIRFLEDNLHIVLFQPLQSSPPIQIHNCIIPSSPNSTITIVMKNKLPETQTDYQIIQFNCSAGDINNTHWKLETQSNDLDCHGNPNQYSLLLTTKSVVITKVTSNGCGWPTGVVIGVSCSIIFLACLLTGILILRRKQNIQDMAEKIRQKQKAYIEAKL